MLGLEKTLKLDLQLPCFPNEETEIHHPPILSNLPQAKLELMWPSFHHDMLPFTLCGLVFKGLYNFFLFEEPVLAIFSWEGLYENIRCRLQRWQCWKSIPGPVFILQNARLKHKQNLEWCSELLAPVLRWQKQVHPYEACWPSSPASS